jgi:heme/copper-type cytochrome/quinol oxidase subunit 2
LKSGFHEFIPEAKLKKFSEQEIEVIIIILVIMIIIVIVIIIIKQYLISGEAKIDTDDWEKNTIYKNCDREATIVTWFWQLITSGDEKFRYKVLQFVTGTQRVVFFIYFLF